MLIKRLSILNSISFFCCDGSGACDIWHVCVNDWKTCASDCAGTWISYDCSSLNTFSLISLSNICDSRCRVASLCCDRICWFDLPPWNFILIIHGQDIADAKLNFHSPDSNQPWFECSPVQTCLILSTPYPSSNTTRSAGWHTDQIPSWNTNQVHLQEPKWSLAPTFKVSNDISPD